MDVQSPESPTRNIFRTPPWESREKVPFGCGSRRELQDEPLAGREATAPSNIREVQIVQGGKEMPPNGGIIHPQNVHVKPLFSKVLLNASLNNRVLGGSVRSNDLPRGHTDLNGGHPGLSKNLLEGILFSKVSPTSL
jgi:hypothetical protein